MAREQAAQVVSKNLPRDMEDEGNIVLVYQTALCGWNFLSSPVPPPFSPKETHRNDINYKLAYLEYWLRLIIN